jgi:adenine-specific DNA methylase
LHYSSPGDIVLDPFCGGGVTVVESLKLGRRVVGVDVNPIATYITTMESRPGDIQEIEQAFRQVSRAVGQEICTLYSTKCANCSARAIADWIEWDEKEDRITRLKYDCPTCGLSKEKEATRDDRRIARNVERKFAPAVKRSRLWFPKTRIPKGDKTNSLLNQKIDFFHELFTRRNLLALSILLKEIEAVRSDNARDFLKFAFSSSLKWASRQSHLRGKIVEGWAMHAYWIYPKSLEINVWNTFVRRTRAVLRGKKYSNEHIGTLAKPAKSFDNLTTGNSSCLILNQSAARLPLPDRSIDAVITDPPYGGNVNYAELSDLWFVWLSRGKTIEKKDEIIVNRTQRKALRDYERLLYAVFKECHRVLKPERFLVSTFNSKDMRIVASFITAASEAGFTLHPDGIMYQKPIRPYTTTFHAMQVGAFMGDFIFSFVKERKSQPQSVPAHNDLQGLKEDLTALINTTVKGGMTEPKLRESAYAIVIPFVAKNAHNNIQACLDAVSFFETKMCQLEPYFKQLRTTITEERKREFRNL